MWGGDSSPLGRSEARAKDEPNDTAHDERKGSPSANHRPRARSTPEIDAEAVVRLPGNVHPGWSSRLRHEEPATVRAPLLRRTIDLRWRDDLGLHALGIDSKPPPSSKNGLKTCCNSRP